MIWRSLFQRICSQKWATSAFFYYVSWCTSRVQSRRKNSFINLFSTTSFSLFSVFIFCFHGRNFLFIQIFVTCVIIVNGIIEESVFNFSFWGWIKTSSAGFVACIILLMHKRTISSTRLCILYTKCFIQNASPCEVFT